ncbi:MAG TPA: winged helix-turn-helix domain-containing protein [Oscillatoriaceae cyanobacterium M33_DOE_052]|nr:winged helix-turn-helix domain-containing protein [Oscillatoriaceae cyanobacterium M33_DOE_052]
MHRNTVSDWWQQYQEFGEIALNQQERGRNVGEGRTLTQEQENRIQQLMQEHFPEDLEIDRALWTRRAVQQLIEQVYEVQMPIRTVGEYLKRWGYTPQKPLKQAYEQDPEAVEEWLEQTYLEIEQRAQAEGVVKQGVHSKSPTRNLVQLKQRLISHLHKLQKLPARVQKYFEHPFIAYAAKKCNLNYCRVNIPLPSFKQS